MREVTYLSRSYTLDAIGLISELINRKPSYGRSSLGLTISAWTCANTLHLISTCFYFVKELHKHDSMSWCATYLVLPKRHSTQPSSSPNVNSSSRCCNRPLPSNRFPSPKAARTNSFCIVAGSISRGILSVFRHKEKRKCDRNLVCYVGWTSLHQITEILLPSSSFGTVLFLANKTMLTAAAIAAGHDAWILCVLLRLEYI